jgi:hypothetical protein
VLASLVPINGGNTRLKGPFHPTGVNCSISGPPGLRSSLGGEAVSARGISLAVLCVHNTAELVFSSLFMHRVHCIALALYVLIEIPVKKHNVENGLIWFNL